MSEHRAWDCFFQQLVVNEVFCDTATLAVIESSNFYGLGGEGKDYIKHKSYCECLGLKESVLMICFSSDQECAFEVNLLMVSTY